jgi:hypothetical protein
MTRRTDDERKAGRRDLTANVTHFAAGQVYRLGAVQEALGLRRTTLPREIRAGRLRAAKRAGRIFILGEWILEWIAAGEVRLRQSK